jgi:hypothetical protein
MERHNNQKYVAMAHFSFHQRDRFPDPTNRRSEEGELVCKSQVLVQVGPPLRDRGMSYRGGPGMDPGSLPSWTLQRHC